jgi:hypothetical protein
MDVITFGKEINTNQISTPIDEIAVKNKRPLVRNMVEEQSQCRVKKQCIDDISNAM